MITKNTRVTFVNWLNETVEGVVTMIAPEWSLVAPGSLTIVGENGVHAGLIYRGIEIERDEVKVA